MIRLLTALGLAGPALVLIGLFGQRAGLFDWTVGYRLLALEGGFWGGLLGLLAEAAAVGLALKARRRTAALVASLVAVAAGLTAGLAARERGGLAANPPVAEAASDWADRPGFSDGVMAARRRDGAAPLRSAGDPAWCPAARTVPRQVSPAEAREALEAAKVQVVGVGPIRAEGAFSSFWWGFDQDVVIRIRPGATDVRVAGREDRPDGGAACALAGRVVAALG